LVDLLSRSGQVDAKKLDFALRVAIRYDQLMYETAQRIKATEERLVMEKERIDVVKRISRIAEQRRHEKNKEWLMRYEKKEAQLTKQLDRLDRKLEKNALKLGDYLTPDDGHKA
jgi:hypothetical protein